MNKLNKILRYPEKIPCDKRMHFMIGVLVAVVMSVLPTSLLVNALVIPVVACGIEFYQYFTKSGQFDNYDALAVMLGGYLVLLPFAQRAIFG